MEKSFKSPRKIEEEINGYRRKRFEDYMTAADRGEIARHIAIQALKDEEDYTLFTIGSNSND